MTSGRQEESVTLNDTVSVDGMARLDMSHGFVEYIRKNQIKRNEFDKTYTPPEKPRRQSRPSIELYQLPRRNRTSDDAQEVTDAPKRSSHPLSRDDDIMMVQINFIDHVENLHHFIIKKTDTPKSSAQNICAKLGYGEPYIAPLANEIRTKCRDYFDYLA